MAEEEKDQKSGKDKTDLSIFINDYLRDAKEGLQEANSALLALEKDHSQTGLLDEVFRAVHTLKSSSVMLEFTDIAELAHITEDLLDRMRKGEVAVVNETIDILFNAVDTLESMVIKQVKVKGAPVPDFGVRVSEIKNRISETLEDCGMQNEELKSKDTAQDNAVKNEIPVPTIEKIKTVRVHIDLLDSLFNLVGELIITKNRIENIVSDTPNKELKAALVAMHYIINTMQDNVSAARLVPVDEIVQKFPRMVRNLAREKGKEIDFIIEGREIELDKAILDAISEPLIHLLRNAVDHGIELPEARQKQNKEKTGTIKLAAKRTENHITFEVEDDGAGIDIKHMKEAAITRGFVKSEEAAALQEKDIMNMLFKPGFTSVEDVTNISGRGVGLDVVKTSVKKMGGTVDVATQKGKGSRFAMIMPLTTAILQTLMVGIGKHIFAIPSDIVLESLEVKPEAIKQIGKDQVLLLRKEAIPFIRLNEILNIPQQDAKKEIFAIIIHRGDKFLAVGVDLILDHTENIVKPFDPVAQQFKGFSGGIILGDGGVALLLDIPTLFGFETLQEEKY